MNSKLTSSKNPQNMYALLIICTVWFFWGFVAASNGIFIPFCKSHFSLNQFQSQLIEFSFYGAYFIGSLFLWLFSQLSRADLLNKLGYKNAIITGLAISVFGALAILPAVHAGSFALILGAFFIIALGFSLQQVASQPYIIALGPPESGTHRISLAGAINSVGTLLGPVVISFIIFGSLSARGENTSVQSIDILYIILALVFLAAMGLLWLYPLPKIQNNEPFERGFGALKYPQLLLGMVAIFVYVGTEVTIQSNMGELLRDSRFGGYETSNISSFISLYWGSLMIGRMAGAISAFRLSKLWKIALTFLVPCSGFILVVGVNVWYGNDVSEFLPYIFCVLLLATGIYFAKDRPFTLLMILSVLGICCMLLGLLYEGKIALYAFISGGLCCSVMWPCIFPSGIAGLGKYTNQGAAFLIMMILGGAVIPPLQGAMADSFGIHISYVVPLLGFVYIAFFAWRVKHVLKKQGLDFDTMQASSGH